MIWRAALIALFAFVVALLAFSWSRSSRIQPYEQQNNQETHDRSAQATDEYESWEALWQRTKRDPIAFFTAVLAISTTLLFVIAIGQLWFLIRAENTASRSAAAAEDSAKTSKDALISVQRAFVFIRSFETVVVNQEFRILPQWENGGSTPTKNARNYVSWKSFVGSPPTDYNWPDIGADGNPLTAAPAVNDFFVAPKGTKYAAILPVPISIIEAVKSGQQRLFVWGWINYHDIFGHDHRTEFCVEITVTAISVENGKTAVAITFGDYGPHNTAR